MGMFEGQRVLVTGASSGIGAGLAERFAREGAVVGICARREDRLAEVRDRCDALTAGARLWAGDLADAAFVDDLAVRSVEELGGVDVLVNNAGIPKRRHVTKLDIETVTDVMAINYLSPIRLTLALLPHLLTRAEPRVVNVSSVAAPLSSPGEAAYDASKAALTSFAEAMAIDLWQTPLRMLTVYPGVVDTELFTIPGNDPLPPGMDPITVDELVDAVFAALDAGDVEVFIPAWFKDIVVGKVENVAGFLAGAADFIEHGMPDLT